MTEVFPVRWPIWAQRLAVTIGPVRGSTQEHNRALNMRHVALVHWLLIADHGALWTARLTKRAVSVQNNVHLGSPSAENSLSINELGTR